MPDLLAVSDGGPVLLGFDFPVGLPLAYARSAGIAHFPDWLAALDDVAWNRFRTPAARPDEIAPARPYFPLRPGGATRAALVEALGVASYAQLMRRCDLPTPHRAAACCMFWTLGPQQCGRAALAGWHEVIRPGLRSGIVRLWPYHGDLPALLEPGRVTVTETYPAECYAHLGLGRRFAKRRQDGRRAQAGALCEATRGFTLAPELAAAIADGFGRHADGEHGFDALVGLLGMLRVATGRRSAGAPDDPDVRRVEGWMLGLTATPRNDGA